MAAALGSSPILPLEKRLLEEFFHSKQCGKSLRAHRIQLSHFIDEKSGALSKGQKGK